MPIQAQSEVPSELHLTCGEQRRFPIGGAGGVGYQWGVTVDGDDGVVSVTIEGPPPPAHGEFQSGSAPKTLVLHALQPGTVRVHLSLERFAEHPRVARAPRASYDIAIIVER